MYLKNQVIRHINMLLLVFTEKFELCYLQIYQNL